MYKPHIYVLIPILNRIAYTKKCLESLHSQSYANVTVIVIDSGSTDGSQEYIRRKYPKSHLIQGDGSWWWTRAMFEGAKYAQSHGNKNDYILEMNNDCYFGPEYLNQLITTAQKYPKAIIGSLCVRHNKPTEVVEAGIRIHWPTGLVYAVTEVITNKLSAYKDIPIIDKLDALPGKGTLVPLSVLEKAGSYNYKRFPHYIADYEFTNRAKRAGFELLVDTKAIVKHYWEATGIQGRSSEKRKSYKRAWNLLFGRKSMNNVIDWLNFILVACPRQYILMNIFITFHKLLKALLSVYPFYYLWPVIRPLLKVYYFCLDIYHAILRFLTKQQIKDVELKK